jgi:hypothetical protein
MTISAITASVSAAVSAAAPAAVAASATAAATTTFGVTSLLAAQAIYGATYVATAVAEAALLGAAASALQSRPSPGVQWRTAQSPLETRRIPCGKVYTAGRSMGDAITWGHANCNAVILSALADVPIGGIASFKVAGNDDTFFGLLVNGYPAAFRYTDAEKGYEISETVNPFTKQRVDDFLVGKGWKFFVQFHLGHDGQTADQWMVSNVPADKWDATAVGVNLAYARAFTFYDSDIFTGFPTFAYYLDGALMYNPAKDSSVGGSGPHRWGVLATYEVSTNPAVIAYNVARGFFSSKGEMVYGSGYEADDLPLDFWIPAIQDCDELITDKDGTQSPRYSCSFEIDLTDEPRKYLKICETAMAGRICEDRGELLAYAGVSQTPIFSFTDADKAQGASNLYDKKLGIDNLKNIVTGKFLSVAECFVQLDAPPRESAADIAEDGGIPLTDAMDLSMIQHGPTAQRVMEATRRRHRAQATCTRTFRLAAQNARKGQWIAGTSKDWDGTKWFEIIKAVPNLHNLTVTMALREVPFNLSDWSAVRDELDKYTITLPSADPLDPLKMTGIVVAPIGEQGGDGSTAPGITVTYAVTDDPSAKQVELQIAKVLASGTHGASLVTTAFSDNTAAAFNPNMVGRLIVIEGAGQAGSEYTGTVAAYTSATAVTLTDPTVTAAAGCSWMVLGDTQCVYDSDPTSGVIKAGNLLGQTLYAYRVKVQGIEGRASEFSDWRTVSTSSGAIPNGSVTGPKIADGTIDPIAKFIAGMDAIKIVSGSVLPTTKITNTIFLLGTAKLYRWSGTAYTAAVDTSDLTGSIVAQQIADASLTTAKFAAGIEPVTLVDGSTVPSVKATSTIFLKGTGKLYRWDATAGAYVASVATTDLAGTIAGGQIADLTLTVAKFASGLEPITIASGTLPTTKSTNAISYGGKLYTWNATTGSYRADVATSDLTGTITGAQIADATLVTTKFASGIEPVTIVTGSIPSTKSTSTIVYGGDLYRWNGSSYVKSVQTTDLSGTIIGSQIAANTITAANIAADTITAAQIAVGAITANEIAAGAITASKLSLTDTTNLITNGSFRGSSGSFTGDGWSVWGGAAIVSGGFALGSPGAIEIPAGQSGGGGFGGQFSVTPGEVYTIRFDATGAVGGYFNVGFLGYTNFVSQVQAYASYNAQLIEAWKTFTAQLLIPAGVSVVAFYFDGQMAAGASGYLTNVVLRKAASAELLVDGSITALKIAAATITGDKIAGATITAAQIAANTITAAQIAAGTITADRIFGSTITGDKIAGSTITAANLAVDSVTAAQIASGAISTDELAANAVTAAKIAVGTITGDRMVANTITGNQIAANTITAANIASGAITADMITTGTLNAALITVTNLSAASITAGTIAVARLPGLSSNNFWIYSQVQAYDVTPPDDTFSELFYMEANGCVAWGRTNIQTLGFPVNSASATITAECRITYHPQTSGQVSARGGFRATTPAGSWVYLPETEVRLYTGSNASAVYQTMIIRCRIPVGSYNAIQPWLHNTTGDKLHVYNVTMEIQQTSA